jgi:hypothetical protein
MPKLCEENIDLIKLFKSSAFEVATNISHGKDFQLLVEEFFDVLPEEEILSNLLNEETFTEAIGVPSKEDTSHNEVKEAELKQLQNTLDIIVNNIWHRNLKPALGGKSQQRAMNYFYLVKRLSKAYYATVKSYLDKNSETAFKGVTKKDAKDIFNPSEFSYIGNWLTQDILNKVDPRRKTDYTKFINDRSRNGKINNGLIKNKLRDVLKRGINIDTILYKNESVIFEAIEKLFLNNVNPEILIENAISTMSFYGLSFYEAIELSLPIICELKNKKVDLIEGTNKNIENEKGKVTLDPYDQLFGADRVNNLNALIKNFNSQISSSPLDKSIKNYVQSFTSKITSDKIFSKEFLPTLSKKDDKEEYEKQQAKTLESVFTKLVEDMGYQRSDLNVLFKKKDRYNDDLVKFIADFDKRFRSLSPENKKFIRETLVKMGITADLNKKEVNWGTSLMKWGKNAGIGFSAVMALTMAIIAGNALLGKSHHRSADEVKKAQQEMLQQDKLKDNPYLKNVQGNTPEAGKEGDGFDTLKSGKPAEVPKALDAQELGAQAYSDINKIQLTSDNPATEVEQIFKFVAKGDSSQMTKIAKSIFEKENSSDGAKIADQNVVKFLLKNNSMPKNLAIDLLADSDNLDPEDVQRLAKIIDANKIKNNTQKDRSNSLVDFLTTDAEQKGDYPTPKVFNAVKTYIKIVGGVKNLSKAEVSYLANNNFIDQPTAEEIRNVHDLSGNPDVQSKINSISGFSQDVSDKLDAAGKYVKGAAGNLVKVAGDLANAGLKKANEKSAQVNDFLKNLEDQASQGRTTSLVNASGEMEKSLADLAKNRVNSLSTDAISQDDARDLKAGALYKYAKTVSEKPNGADKETTDLMQKYVKAVDNKVGPSPDSSIKQAGDMVGAGAKYGMDYFQGKLAIKGDLKKISSGNYEGMSKKVAQEFKKEVDKLSVTKISDNKAEDLQRGDMYKLAKSIVSAAESSDDGSADSGIPSEKMGDSTKLDTNSDSYKLAKSYIDKIDSSDGHGKFLKAGLNWLDNTKEKLAQDKYQVPETPTPLLGGDSSKAPNSIIGKVLTDKDNFNADELKQVLSDDPAWTGAILLKTPDKAATTEKIIKAYGIANVPQDIIKYLAGFGDVGPGTAVKLLDGGTGVYDDETRGLLLKSIQSLKPATDQESAETINKIKQGNIPSEAEIAKAGSAGQLGNLLKAADQTKKAEMTQKVIDSYGGTKNIGNIVAKYLATDGSLSPEQAKQLLDTGNRISNMDKVSAANKYDTQTMKMLQNIANQQQNESVNFVNFKTFMEDFKFITLKKPKVCVFDFC